MTRTGRAFLSLPLLLLLAGAFAWAQSGRIYTEPAPDAAGGIEGKSGTRLTLALAVDHEREHVYKGELAADAFRFTHIPAGKYDLVLLTSDNTILEGLSLGSEPADKMPEPLRKNFEKRISVADSFFNRYVIHRAALEGDTAFALVERLRDKETLKQSGEKLEANVRRIEIVELARATDDWQYTRTRHIYREPEPIRSAPPFFQHRFVPALGNIRVVDTIKTISAQ